jgi:Flp pilus assembly protein TadG
VTRTPANDEGTATIEFVGVSLVLLIPLIYLLLSVFAVQRSAFAVTQAAREAGRAFATANSSSEGMSRARYAARLALSDQRIDDGSAVSFAPVGSDCKAASGNGAATLTPGARFVVCVRTTARLPLAPIRAIPVHGQFQVAVDEYRRAR